MEILPAERGKKPQTTPTTEAKTLNLANPCLVKCGGEGRMRAGEVPWLPSRFPRAPPAGRAAAARPRGSPCPQPSARREGPAGSERPPGLGPARPEAHSPRGALAPAPGRAAASCPRAAPPSRLDSSSSLLPALEHGRGWVLAAGISALWARGAAVGEERGARCRGECPAPRAAGAHT